MIFAAKPKVMKNSLLFLGMLLLFFSCKKASNTGPETLPNAYSDQAIGKSANDLLSASKYTSLQIQIQYMGTYQLDTATISNLSAYLNSLCNKPGGISITQTAISATGDTLDLDKVATLEKQYRTDYTSGSTIAVYIMVTDGYDTSASILGFAYRNTSICLFGKDIFANSGASGEVTRVSLETSVLEHEFGHLMGLVNLGSTMVSNHQDLTHGNHCINPACLMYWSIETHTGLPGLLNNIPKLDSNCLADLAANGGK